MLKLKVVRLNKFNESYITPVEFSVNHIRRREAAGKENNKTKFNILRTGGHTVLFFHYIAGEPEPHGPFIANCHTLDNYCKKKGLFTALQKGLWRVFGKDANIQEIWVPQEMNDEYEVLLKKDAKRFWWAEKGSFSQNIWGGYSHEK